MGLRKSKRYKFNSVQQIVTRHYSAMMRLYRYQRKQELETNMQRRVEKESICASKLLFHTVMHIFQSGLRAEEFLNTCSWTFLTQLKSNSLDSSSSCWLYHLRPTTRCSGNMEIFRKNSKVCIASLFMFYPSCHWVCELSIFKATEKQLSIFKATSF